MSILVDTTHLNIYALEVLHCHLCLLALGVLCNDFLVGKDGILAVTDGVVYHCSLGQCTARCGTARECSNELVIYLYGVAVFLLLDVVASHLIHRLLGILALGELVDESLQGIETLGLVVLEALYLCIAIERVVGILVERVCCLCIVACRIFKVALVEMAVGNAVVCVGDCLAVALVGGFHKSLETAACIVVTAFVEICISHSVCCQAVALGAAVKRLHVAAACTGHIALAELCLALPEECIALCLGIVLRKLQRAVHVVYCAVHVAVHELLHTKAVKDILLCLKNLGRGVLYLVYRLERHIVVAGVVIDLNEVLANLVGMLGCGVVVEELFECLHALGKGRVACLVNAECVVVESLLAHTVVICHCGGALQCKACTATVVVGKVNETDVQVGALRDGVFMLNAWDKHAHCLLVLAVHVLACSQLVHCHALRCVVVLHVDGESLLGVLVIALHELGSTKHLVHAVILGYCRLVVVEIVSCPVGGTCNLALFQPYAGYVVLRFATILCIEFKISESFICLVEVVTLIVQHGKVESGILVAHLACERQVHEQVLGCALVAAVQQ